MVEEQKVAFIFPGQGAQFVGMGKDLYENFSSSKKIFDTADDILGYSIKELCFEGPMDKLSNTDNSQIAILTASIAALDALRESGLKVEPEYLAGLSLGEYSGLVASESIDFETALKLVEKRGKFMHRASIENPGKMASVIGLNKQDVEEIANQSNTQMVNFNCPHQIVLSGSPEAIEKAEKLAKGMGVKRFIILKISGAFHSRFMDEASRRLNEELNKVDFKTPNVKVVFNISAIPEEDTKRIKENLSNQVNHATYWQKSIEYIQSNGINSFIEIGHGKVLKGLLRRINPEFKVYNAGNLKDIEELKKEQRAWF